MSDVKIRSPYKKFALVAFGSLQNGVNTCPGLWMFLEGRHEGIDLLALCIVAACVHRHDDLSFVLGVHEIIHENAIWCSLLVRFIAFDHFCKKLNSIHSLRAEMQEAEFYTRFENIAVICGSADTCRSHPRQTIRRRYQTKCTSSRSATSRGWLKSSNFSSPVAMKA